MTPFNAQHKDYPAYRQKCAEICGWKLITGDAKVVDYWLSPDGKSTDARFNMIPTYLDDASIDAVVRKLDDRQLFDYSDNLIEVMGDDFRCSQHIHKATEEQKAEALCRTLMGEGC